MMQATTPWVIEAVDPQHRQALALLGEAVQEACALYPKLLGGAGPPPSNPPLRAREVYLLAWRDEGQALGCGALRQLDAYTAELHRLYVTRAARRKGVASALLEQLEHEAQALGYRQLVLETGAHEKPAIALYRGCGWRRIAAFGPYVDDPASVCFGKPVLPQR
jgi:putative acetyltransferase